VYRYKKHYTVTVLAENLKDAEQIYQDFEKSTEVGIIDEMIQNMNGNKYDGYIFLDKTDKISPEGKMDE
jgi:hypothetical protein